MASAITREQRIHNGVVALWFGANDWVPNNPSLPALIYHDAIAPALACAEAFEQRFRETGWSPQWRNGVYEYHHFHSTAHEALGIASGKADLLLGGPNGPRVTVAAGACVVLPAGTGHCLVTASSDFLVVGAYPPGQLWDLQRGPISATRLALMQALPIPLSDPVRQTNGVLEALWGHA